MAGDYDETVSGATAAGPQVLVTEIWMPPTFQREGIDAAKEARKRHPGTGIVVLSQYQDPEYAVSLLAEGSTVPSCHSAAGSSGQHLIRRWMVSVRCIRPVARRSMHRAVVTAIGICPMASATSGA